MLVTQNSYNSKKNCTSINSSNSNSNSMNYNNSNSCYSNEMNNTERIDNTINALITNNSNNNNSSNKKKKKKSNNNHSMGINSSNDNAHSNYSNSSSNAHSYSSNSNSNNVASPFHDVNDSHDDNDNHYHHHHNITADDDGDDVQSIKSVCTTGSEMMMNMIDNSADIIIDKNNYIKKNHTIKSIKQWIHNTSLNEYEKCAVLIQFARDGEEHSIFASTYSLLAFRLRSYLSPYLRYTSALLLLLKFFERPLWTYSHEHWNNDKYYPMSGIPLLSSNITGIIRLVILCFLWFGIILELIYKESGSYIKFIKNLNTMQCIRCFLFIYTFIQIIIIIYGLIIYNTYLITITSIGTVMHFLWFNRRTFNKLKIIMMIIPSFIFILLMFLIIILLFAGFGPILFNINDVNNDDDYFTNFSNSIWTIFVAITSSNYPNQIMPSYRKHREVLIYFVSFISVGAFIVLNLCIIIILVEFQKAIQKFSDIHTASTSVLLIRAFQLLDRTKCGYLTKSQIHYLLYELYTYYSDFQKSSIPSIEQRDILIQILDNDNDGLISINDFLCILDITKIKLSLHHPKRFIEIIFPSIVTYQIFQIIEKIVKYKYFNLILDIIISILILFTLYLHSNNIYEYTKEEDILIIITIIIMTFEFCSKLIIYGYKGYKRKLRNLYDFSLLILLWLMMIGEKCYTEYDNSNNNNNDNQYDFNGFIAFIRVLLFLRFICLPRNGHIKIFRNIEEFIKRLISKSFTLFIIFLCAGYIFATIGQFIYGGKIMKTNDNNNFINSAYIENDFWGLNFNDFTNSCITLFCCLHISDFDIIASGFTTTTTNNDWNRLYFALWYIIGVLFLLNILKSFILGEFIILFSNDTKSNDNDDDNNNNNNNGNCDGVNNNNNNDDDLIHKDKDNVNHPSQLFYLTSNTTAEISNVSIDDSDYMEAQMNNKNKNNKNNDNSSNYNSKSQNNTFHVSRSSNPSIQSMWEGNVVIHSMIIIQTQFCIINYHHHHYHRNHHPQHHHLHQQQQHDHHPQHHRHHHHQYNIYPPCH